MDPWATESLLARDLTDPLSMRSIHVTGPDDLRSVGDWSIPALYATVEAADDRGGVVVLDYDEAQLYLSEAVSVEEGPLGLLGHGGTLAVREPVLAEPTADGSDVELTPLETTSLTVDPPWDVLVPAFDLEELDDQLPPIETVSRPSPSGAGTWSPG
ncbi:MAG: hypothetical protein ABEJ35_06060 [Halobacteriaceae archaeon]